MDHRLEIHARRRSTKWRCAEALRSQRLKERPEAKAIAGAHQVKRIAHDPDPNRLALLDQIAKLGRLKARQP